MPLASQEKEAFHRLEHLYEISKLLAAFESVEWTLPAILGSASVTLPLWTAVVMEKQGDAARITVFQAAKVSAKHAREALENARAACGEAAGIQLSLAKEFETAPAVYRFFQGAPVMRASEALDLKNLISLPLAVYQLAPFGAIQLELTTAPSPLDQEFAVALVNLIAVALDRFSIAQRAIRLQEREVASSATQLSQSQGQVTTLETEREIRNRFVATLTHDLRTPLTSARMNAELIMRQPANAEVCLQLANRIKGSIDRMDHMIQDLLDTARIRAGERLPLKIEECDLHEIAVEILRDLSSQQGQRFLLETNPPGEGVRGFWSRDIIRRMIENLLNNAIKYGFADRPITLSLFQTELVVEISVHNEGDPLSFEEQAALFRPFHRASLAEQGEQRGWGLGLAFVHGAAEAHGGSVRIESAPGKGTRFIVALPKDSRPFAG